MLHGDPAPPLKGRRPPQKNSAHVYCGQMAGWIKMALGMEVGLSPRDFVLDGSKLYPQKRGNTHPHPICDACLLWPNGCMDADATSYGSRPQSRPHCIRRGPSCLRKGHSSPPLFGPCPLWSRLPISAAAELLFDLAKPSIYYRKGNGVPTPNPLFVLLTVSAVEVPKVTHRGDW